MDRGWRHTDNDVEDMGENSGNTTHSTSTAANVQNFASNAMKSLSTTLFSNSTSTSTSRPIQTYAIHQKVNTTDGDDRNANRRRRDRGEENGALSSQLADEETVTF